MRNYEIGADGRWLTVESDASYDLIPGLNPMGVQETLTATAPACDLGKYLTDLDSNSNVVAATLADGVVHGQMKLVQCSVRDNVTTLTLASAESSSLDVIAFTILGDKVLLQWYDQDDDGAGYWKILARSDLDADLDTPGVS